MLNYDKQSRIFPSILLTLNHIIFFVQFGINKHLLIFSKTTNLPVLIYSKLHSKSCDYLYKHFRNSPCQTSCVVFQKCTCALSFPTRTLIDRCQIVIDTCKNNVSKFVWKPLKSILSFRKWCFSEASPFNLHHLYFNYHLLALKLFSLWKIFPYLLP